MVLRFPADGGEEVVGVTFWAFGISVVQERICQMALTKARWGKDAIESKRYETEGTDVR